MRDETYLAKLRDYFAQHKVLPSFAAIAQLLGLRSTSSISALVGRLKERGYLESGPTGRLAPGPRFFERPVLHGAHCAEGQALVAEGRASLLTVDDLLVPVPSKSVLLRMKDDAMLDAGLLAGDTLVVEKGAAAKVGEVVVAIVHDEFIVRTLAWDERSRRFYLQPANKGYAPTRTLAEAELEIFGKVVSSFRVHGLANRFNSETTPQEGERHAGK